MRYEPAWNLVGVPSDAKDAAQAAAREAGLSVGEWLTRNILTSLNEIEIPKSSEPRTHLSSQLSELSERLREFEQQSDVGPLRAAVKKLHEGLTRLAGEFVQTTGQSAIHFSNLANKIETVDKVLDEMRAEISQSTEAAEFRLVQATDDATAKNAALAEELKQLTGMLDDIRSDTSGKVEVVEQQLKNKLDELDQKSSQTSVALNDQLRQLAERSAGQSAAMSGVLEKAVDKLDNVSVEISVLHKTLADRITHLTEKSALQESAVARKLEALSEVVDSNRADASKSSAALDERLSRFIEQSSGQVSALSGKQDALSAELTAKTDLLAENLARSSEASGSNEAVLSARLDALETLLRKIQKEAPVISGQLDARLAELADSSTNRHALLSSRFENLAGTVEALQAEKSETTNSLSKQLSDLDAKLRAQDLKQTGVSQALADKFDGVDRAFVEIQNKANETVSALEQRLSLVRETIEGVGQKQVDVSRSVDGEIAQLKAQIGKIEADASGASDAVEQRLSQSAEEAAVQQSRLAEQLVQLTQAAAQSQTETAAKIEKLEQGFAQKTSQWAALTNQLVSMNELLVSDRTDVTNLTGIFEQRLTALQDQLQRVESGGSETISALEAKFKDLSENLTTLQSKAWDTSRALEQLIKQSSSEPNPLYLELSGKLNSLNGVVEQIQRDSTDAITSFGQQLTDVQTGLKSLTAQQSETASALANVGEIKSATGTSIADLEDAIGKLQAHLPERALEERLAAVERCLTDMLARASAEKLHVADAPETHSDAISVLPPFVEPDAQPMDIPPLIEAAIQSFEDTSFPAVDDENSQHPEDQDHSKNAPSASFHIPAADSNESSEVPPIAVASENKEVAVSSDQRKSATSYLSAARQAASAANKANVEIVATELLGEQASDTSQSIGKRLLGSTSVRLAGAVALLAVSAVGVGAYLTFSSGSHSEAVHPARAVSGALPKRTVTLHPALAGSTSASTQNTQDWDRIATQAQSGDAHAALMLGLHNIGNGGDAAAAVKWLQIAATNGDAIAQFRLGTFYALGRGVPVDPQKAFEFYKSSAALGNRLAMYNLAVAYVQGTGTAINLPEAVRWFSNAANLGVIDAQFDLAVLYERGTGVAQSLPNAYRWYAIAANGGDKESKVRIEALDSQISGAERAAAEAAAAQFKALPVDVHANLFVP